MQTFLYSNYTRVLAEVSRIPDVLLTISCYAVDKVRQDLFLIAPNRIMKSDRVPAQKGKYISYLLRIWEANLEGHSTWLASLEWPGSKERQNFSNLDELFDFLRTEVEQNHWEKISNKRSQQQTQNGSNR